MRDLSVVASGYLLATNGEFVTSQASFLQATLGVGFDVHKKYFKLEINRIGTKDKC